MSRLLVWQISALARASGITSPLIIVTAPTFAAAAFSLDRRGVLYYRSDLHSAFEEADAKMLRANEALLFERADAVLYANERLYQAERHRLGGRAVLIGHGIDASMFAPEGPLAPEMTRIPRPRAGFFGDLRKRSLDFELLGKVADLCPSIQFVLGGTQLDDLAALKARDNVHVLPPCAHERMPERWRSVDVAILPYRRTPWQDACQPIKLNEILATGLPAVGVSLPALEARAPTVETADDPEAFAAALRRALTTRRGPSPAPPPMRSWDAIAQQVLNLGPAGGTPRSAEPSPSEAWGT